MYEDIRYSTESTTIGVKCRPTALPIDAATCQLPQQAAQNVSQPAPAPDPSSSSPKIEPYNAAAPARPMPQAGKQEAHVSETTELPAQGTLPSSSIALPHRPVSNSVDIGKRGREDDNVDGSESDCVDSAAKRQRQGTIEGSGSPRSSNPKRTRPWHSMCALESARSAKRRRVDNDIVDDSLATETDASSDTEPSSSRPGEDLDEDCIMAEEEVQQPEYASRSAFCLSACSLDSRSST